MIPPSPQHETPLPRLPAFDAAPVLEALAVKGGVLAMLTKVSGGFYRALGSIMAILPDGTRIGQISGGCIEGDLVHHAATFERTAQTLRYGRGSPFVDLRLPCGSSIDVTLLRVKAGAIAPALGALASRQIARLSLAPLPEIEITPALRVALFGTGPETDRFATLARAAGLEILRPNHPAPADMDPFTAVALFFHDHHREISILRAALASNAFWIGAQGSVRAQNNRLAALRNHGFGPADLKRVRGPVGLIPRARDPQTLAISVLAEIVSARP